jgi:hypothetical protein
VRKFLDFSSIDNGKKIEHCQLMSSLMGKAEYKPGEKSNDLEKSNDFWLGIMCFENLHFSAFTIKKKK